MSYRRKVKAILVEALRKTFDASYPVTELRNMHVSIEYPIDRQHYPSIWTDFEESRVYTAGIDHKETDEDGNLIHRWRFEGHASYTIAGLTSLERDKIFDELIKIMAFSHSSEHLSAFREFIEDNDYVAMNFDFDEIQVAGNAATPGTPWETDEIIYESTLIMQVLGEFVTDVDTGDLVPLSKIIIDAREMGSTEEEPTGPLHWEIDQNAAAPFDPSQWH